MIPVHVLTGFLGSGKTSLLRRLLHHPEMGRTAVIVNEFGEIGIDHDLLATSDEHFVELSNGCLCCQVRSDLVKTLGELALRRRTDGGSGFVRVVIETSGLADPVPVVNVLGTDAQVRREFRLAGVITTVDGVFGAAALEQHVETARQVALADCIVITKIDRADARASDVEQAVRRMRPEVPILHSTPGRLEPADLFRTSGRDQSSAEPPVWVPSLEIAALPLAPMHSSGIGSLVVVRRAPLHAATLPLFLSAMAEHYGQDLLRLKGIVRIAEDPDRPAVIHGVQHVYDAPGWLSAWPGADRSTRIVCIGRRLHAEWIHMLLELLDEEVADEAGRRRPSPNDSQ